MPDFTPGWTPEQGIAATDRMLASGNYCVVNEDDATPIPSAFSLSQYRTRHLEQAEQGTCWEHSPAQLFSISAIGLGYQEFPACRRLIGYAGKQLEGGGNQADGGSPTDAIRTMIPGGVGVAHEDLCPYANDRNVLGQKPPQNVFDDAVKSHLIAPVHIPPDFNTICKSIFARHAVANGFNCPQSFEQQGVTFINTIGKILGGHSELIIGYAQPGVFGKTGWLEFENWWGLIYRPLSTQQAALVKGYKPVTPTATSSAWVCWETVYKTLLGMGQTEHVSATDVAGLIGGKVKPAKDYIKVF